MVPIELRDTQSIHRFLVQGLALQLANSPTASTVRPILEWTMELAIDGHPLPPVGFIADIGRFLLGMSSESTQPGPRIAALPPSVVRSYSDHVLGKAYSDRFVNRAADAIRRLRGRDRNRGIAYVIHRCQERMSFHGTLLPTASIKVLLESPPDEVLTQGWASLESDGIDPTIQQLYDELIAQWRFAGDILAPEDLFELEHGLALGALADRIAVRQVLQAAHILEEQIPKRPFAVIHSRGEAPMPQTEEDAYPVGGYAAIANRGSLDSLLHSQLAYMEPSPPSERPDLFDVKFVRDELLYYSRDENQFLRRRRTFIFALQDDLAQARYKDTELPFQRIVLTLAIVVVAIRKLVTFLETDALRFEIVFPQDESSLAEEERVLRTILHDMIGTNMVEVYRADSSDSLERRVQFQSKSSVVRPIQIGVSTSTASETGLDFLSISGSRPQLSEMSEKSDEEPLVVWARVLNAILERWL